jgi:hypothetical protein
MRPPRFSIAVLMGAVLIAALDALLVRALIDDQTGEAAKVAIVGLLPMPTILMLSLLLMAHRGMRRAGGSPVVGRLRGLWLGGGLPVRLQATGTSLIQPDAWAVWARISTDVRAGGHGDRVGTDRGSGHPLDPGLRPVGRPERSPGPWPAGFATGPAGPKSGWRPSRVPGRPGAGRESRLGRRTSRRRWASGPDGPVGCASGIMPSAGTGWYSAGRRTRAEVPTIDHASDTDGDSGPGGTPS